MDIQFEKPCNFRLEVVETDERVPSIRASVQIIVEQFQNVYRYEGAFWIQCSVWDSFVQALHSPSRSIVPLHDISENFVLWVQSTNEGLVLTWKFAKADVDGNRKMSMNFTSIIDEEILARIRQQFDDFPTWW